MRTRCGSGWGVGFTLVGLHMEAKLTYSAEMIGQFIALYQTTTP